MKLLVLILLITGFVHAVDVDLDCPDDIYVGEEFECEVEVEDGEERYDLKIEVDEERDSVLRIWDGEDWKSGYYYLKDFVRDDEVVLLKILEEGRFDVVLKLRYGEWRKEFDVGKIRVEMGENNPRIDADGADSDERDEGVEVISLGGDDDVILLGGDDYEEDEEWDYVSKDGMVVDWLPYVFCLFLIGLVGVLMWDRAGGK